MKKTAIVLMMIAMVACASMYVAQSATADLNQNPDCMPGSSNWPDCDGEEGGGADPACSSMCSNTLQFDLSICHRNRQICNQVGTQAQCIALQSQCFDYANDKYDECYGNC